MPEGGSSTNAASYRGRLGEVLSPILFLAVVLIPAALLQDRLVPQLDGGIFSCFLAAVVGTLALSLLVPRTSRYAKAILFAYLLATGANLVMLLVGAREGSVAPLRLVVLFLFAALASVLPQFFSALRTSGVIERREGEAGAAARMGKVGERVWNGPIATIAAVAALVVTSFALRYWQLTEYGVIYDEHKQLDAVIALAETGSLGYRRAGILTYLASFISALGSATSYEATLRSVRAISVFFGAITVIPLYFYARSISRPVALLACAMWTFSPWTIGVSRYFREYSLYCFLITLVLAGLHCGVPLVSRMKRRDSKSIAMAALLVAFLACVLSYAAFDNSTLKFSFVVCAVTVFTLGLLHSRRALLAMRTRPGIWLLVLPVLLAGAAFAAVFVELPHFDIGQVVPSWAHKFLNPNTHSPIHWWGGSQNDPLAVYFLILAGLVLCRLNDSSSSHLVIFGQFALYVACYVFLFDRYVISRYVYYIMPVFVTLIASSCWQLLRSLDIVGPRLVRNAAQVLMAVALIAFFDVRNGYRVVERPLIDSHGERHLHFVATDENHYMMGAILMFFYQFERAELQSDAYVGTLASPAMKIEFGVQNWFPYDFHDDRRFSDVLEVVTRHPDGWIIVDDLRNDRGGFPKRKHFRFGPRTMRLVHDRDEFKIYRWKKTQASDKTIPRFRPPLDFSESG